MLYLDDACDGGATRFLDPNMPVSPEYIQRPAEEACVLATVRPEAGACLLFFQPGLLHEAKKALTLS